MQTSRVIGHKVGAARPARRDLELAFPVILCTEHGHTCLRSLVDLDEAELAAPYVDERGVPGSCRRINKCELLLAHFPLRLRQLRAVGDGRRNFAGNFVQ